MTDLRRLEGYYKKNISKNDCVIIFFLLSFPTSFLSFILRVLLFATVLYNKKKTLNIKTLNSNRLSN